MKKAQTTELTMDTLREKDILISDQNEVFEVNKSLGQNVLCCKNELAFRLKSLDHKNKYDLITAQLKSSGSLNIIGFKKHQPYSGLK